MEAPKKNWRSFVDDWCSPFRLLRWLFNMVPSWNQTNIRAGTMLEIMIGRRAASCWRKSLHSHAILSHLYPVTPVYLHINFSEENSTCIYKIAEPGPQRYIYIIYIYPGVPKIIIFSGFPVKIIALLRGFSINKSRGQIFFQSNYYKTYVYHECIRSHISLPSSKFRRRPKCNATAFQQGV